MSTSQGGTVPIKDFRLESFVTPKRISGTQHTCRVCHNPTQEGKAECVEHIHLRPYISKILQKLDQQEKDAVAITKYGIRAVREDGLHFSEILNLLREKEQESVGRISHTTQFSTKIVSACLRKAAELGLVKLRRTKRGNTMAIML